MSLIEPVFSTDRFKSFLCAGLALAALGWATSVSQAAPENLLRDLVDTLNTKDKARITTFVQSYATTNVPIEQRVERFVDLAEQGAPFSIVGNAESKPGSIRARIRDRNAIELDFTIEIKGNPPKLARIMARPVSSPEAEKDRAGYASLQALAEDVTKDTRSPAMSISVIHKGKLESVVTGVRELGKPTKVGPEEPFEIGSIGKSVTSSLIGSLVEQGKLRFDMTLKEALPGFVMKPGYESVTLEQVMHHRGGIPADPGMRRNQVEKIVGDAKTPVDIRKNYVKDILSRDMAAKPDTEFIYSNAGYSILSKVAEIAGGRPFDELIHERVFKPLGLHHSFVDGVGVPEEKPSGHVPGPEGLNPVLMGGPMMHMFAGAGGGMWMTTADLATYGKAHLDGLLGNDRFLKASTIQRLHTGVSEGGEGRRSYACGWGIVTEQGLPVKHGHNGSDGTFRAELAMYPELDLVVAAIVNRGGEAEPTPGELVIWAVAKRVQKRG